jgi:hypothetical protein
MSAFGGKADIQLPRTSSLTEITDVALAETASAEVDPEHQ